jgi:hypothetical protein
MNQEQIKEKLQDIHESSVDYKVIFSGKRSAKAYGLYKTRSREIIIHNENFIDGNGKQDENMIMSTAIHELTHHIIITEWGESFRHSHNQNFWLLYNNLLDIAESKGIYHLEIDAEKQKLIEEIREISVKTAELQRELGKVIFALNTAFEGNDIHLLYIIDRKAQISRNTMRADLKAVYSPICVYIGTSSL